MDCIGNVTDVFFGNNFHSKAKRECFAVPLQRKWKSSFLGIAALLVELRVNGKTAISECFPVLGKSCT